MKLATSLSLQGSKSLHSQMWYKCCCPEDTPAHTPFYCCSKYTWHSFSPRPPNTRVMPILKPSFTRKVPNVHSDQELEYHLFQPRHFQTQQPSQGNGLSEALCDEARPAWSPGPTTWVSVPAPAVSLAMRLWANSLLVSLCLSDLVHKPGDSRVRTKERTGGTFLCVNGACKPYLLNVPNPVPDVVKGLLIGDVVDQHDALRRQRCALDKL